MIQTQFCNHQIAHTRLLLRVPWKSHLKVLHKNGHHKLTLGIINMLTCFSSIINYVRAHSHEVHVPQGFFAMAGFDVPNLQRFVIRSTYDFLIINLETNQAQKTHVKLNSPELFSTPVLMHMYMYIIHIFPMPYSQCIMCMYSGQHASVLEDIWRSLSVQSSFLYKQYLSRCFA